MKHRKQGLKILPHSSLLGGSIAANALSIAAVAELELQASKIEQMMNKELLYRDWEMCKRVVSLLNGA